MPNPIKYKTHHCDHCPGPDGLVKIKRPGCPYGSEWITCASKNIHAHVTYIKSICPCYNKQYAKEKDYPDEFYDRIVYLRNKKHKTFAEIGADLGIPTKLAPILYKMCPEAKLPKDQEALGPIIVDMFNNQKLSIELISERLKELCNKHYGASVVRLIYLHATGQKHLPKRKGATRKDTYYAKNK